MAVKKSTAPPPLDDSYHAYELECERRMLEKTGLPHYDAAMPAIAAAAEWSRQGFPDATLEQVIAIANNKTPERHAVAIRLRAERNINKLLRGGPWPPEPRRKRGQP
jgi:hypothetical protein